MIIAMAQPTGHNIPASDILPRNLLSVLNVFMVENGLAGWEIYTVRSGAVHVKLHFGQPEVEKHSDQAGFTNAKSPIRYANKSPCQVRRDNKRITRSQKSSVNNIESVRSDSEIMDNLCIDSPVQVKL